MRDCRGGEEGKGSDEQCSTANRVGGQRVRGTVTGNCQSSRPTLSGAGQPARDETIILEYDEQKERAQ